LRVYTHVLPGELEHARKLLDKFLTERAEEDAVGSLGQAIRELRKRRDISFEWLAPSAWARSLNGRSSPHSTELLGRGAAGSGWRVDLALGGAGCAAREFLQENVTYL
jgi:hypothetical protein